MNWLVHACRSTDSQIDLESYAQRQWWVRTRLMTSILVNMGNIMERADEQILPALYGFVAASFHIGPTQLGYLTLSRALVQAVSSPLGGILGQLPMQSRVIPITLMIVVRFSRKAWKTNQLMPCL